MDIPYCFAYVMRDPTTDRWSRCEFSTSADASFDCRILRKNLNYEKMHGIRYKMIDIGQILNLKLFAISVTGLLEELNNLNFHQKSLNSIV